MPDLLPRATPERGNPPRPEAPATLSLVDPSLEPARGFRLYHRHAHAALDSAMSICILGQGIDGGDSPGKSMMVLNGFLAQGYSVVHLWQKTVGETKLMVIVFGNV